jgi:4-carboxymuconolactone decarboxylase
VHRQPKEDAAVNANIVDQTRQTAALDFDGVKVEKPYARWKAFDKDLARDLSLFIAGLRYSRE